MAERRNQIDATLEELAAQQHGGTLGKMIEEAKWKAWERQGLLKIVPTGLTGLRNWVLGFHGKTRAVQRSGVYQMSRKRCQSPCGVPHAQSQMATWCSRQQAG